jgi:hypothetical protein
MADLTRHTTDLAARVREALERLEILPDNLGGKDAADRSGLQRVALMGFSFEIARTFPLFRGVANAPADWSVTRMKPGEKPPLWYWLLDNRGRRRATIFYYEGSFGIGGSTASAHLALVPRFAIVRQLGGSGYTVAIAVEDSGRVIRRFGVQPDLDRETYRTSGEFGRAAEQRNADMQQAWVAAMAWLRDRAPDHADTLAYWDDDFMLPEEG